MVTIGKVFSVHMGEEAMASSLIGKQAIVVGAGMGGLAAAGAIAQHFEQVVVVERDALPAEPTHRPGIPQGQHPHGLLISGQRALSALFPDFEQDLVRAGAVSIVTGPTCAGRTQATIRSRDAIWAWAYTPCHACHRACGATRVEGPANVRLRQRCRVEELLATPDGATVTGVRCVQRERPRERQRPISPSTPPTWRHARFAE
jgi:2-polyprenyl-6-methoxyphenol hydroxylase-like FAD-dependent oxidoreductase